MAETVTTGEEKERSEILRRYRKLLKHAKPVLRDGDAKIIKKAFNISNDAHRDMRRKSGEPYIYHPLDVAQICVAEIGLGTTSIVCALLHDVVEDTDWEIYDIRREFGDKAAVIIDGLTKISSVPGETSSSQAENFRKLLLTLAQDTRVILIKLADRLHNMRTLSSMPHHKQLKIASETTYIYAPMAHRLGLYAIKSELEDLSLKYHEPEVYQEITENIKANEEVRARFIRSFIRPINKAIKDRGLNADIKGRSKSVHSIWNKMRKQDIPFQEVYDLFAIRIVVDIEQEKEKAACWQIYSIVTDFYQPNPDRLRDWISSPRSNGYESLHTTVLTRKGSDKGKWVEVQIRSRRMDDIAEKGYAAHWKYKNASAKEKESALDLWINRVRETLALNDISALEFVDDFRSNLFSEEVYAFTPKGKLLTLPNGATALDFAFDIHTDIGAACIGAKINKKLEPIHTRLNNGDQVEIITSSKQRPKEDWLKIVKTSKAKSSIRDALKEGKKKAAVEGKEIVIRKLRQMKLELDKQTINTLNAHFKTRTPLDLFYAVGTGKIDPSEIKKISEVKKERRQTLRKLKNFIGSKVKQQPRKDDSTDVLLLGDDLDKLDYKLSACCSPIPGDDVFGFVTSSNGIKVHSVSCPNAQVLMSNYAHRVIKAKWNARHEVDFLAGIKVVGTDRMNMISDIAGIISKELKVNMKSLTLNTDSGIFDGSIEVYVNNTAHLKVLMKKIRSIPGVDRVSRFQISGE